MGWDGMGWIRRHWPGVCVCVCVDDLRLGTQWAFYFPGLCSQPGSKESLGWGSFSNWWLKGGFDPPFMHSGIVLLTQQYGHAYNRMIWYVLCIHAYQIYACTEMLNPLSYHIRLGGTNNYCDVTSKCRASQIM